MKTFILYRSEKFDDIKFLQAVLESAPTQGGSMTTSEVRSALRILDVMEVLPEEPEVEFCLEDSDFSHLLGRLDQIRWLRVDRQALALVDRIKAAG